MGVRLSDIAREVGVSEATVSLALNNKDVVRAETKLKILDAAQRMGYSPNAMAKTLAQQRSNIIGLVITDIANAYFGQFSKSCVARILENGYQPFIASSQDKYALEERVIDQFIAQRVAGVIIVPPSRDGQDVRYLKKLENYGIRYIYATAHYSACDAPYIMVDLKKGSYQAVKYLLDMGHRHIYFLGSDPRIVPTLMRLEGYRMAYAERGLATDDRLIVCCEGTDFESGYSETIRLLHSGTEVDAIVTINDVMALGCLRALIENGLRVPEDISLIGYDDIIYAGLATIPLTTVHQDVDSIAKRSVNMLLQMIRDNVQSHEKVLIEPHLIVRNSSGVCKRLRQS